MSQEILVGPERRRRWSDGEKIAILIEASDPDMTVAEVARRHGITRQHIYQWRSDMRQGRLVDENGGPFLAVEYVGPPDGNDGDAPSSVDGLIESACRVLVGILANPATGGDLLVGRTKERSDAVPACREIEN